MASNDSRYAIGKNLLMAILAAVGLFSAVIFLSNSWIKIMTIVLIVAVGVIWLMTHNLLRRTLKYTLFVVMIFSISFSAFESYLFRNAGPSPTFGNSQTDVTLSYPNILNVSLTEVIQSTKNTLAFKLFMIEHPGRVGIQTITLNTGLFRGGMIEVEFNSFFNRRWGNSIRFSATNGRFYHATVTSFTLVSWPSLQINYQLQTPDDAIQQMDTLGLQWYYDCAVEAYQNKTGVAPEINALQISIQWENQATYEGMTVLMIGSYENNSHGNGVFFINFQPDGTLNYINITS
jgi:hypothetical protein